MARYRKANPLIWDQAVMVDGTDLDRSVWMLLHLGPQVTNLPGLFMATGASLADILRRDRAEVEETLVHFEGLGLIQRDERARVMRLVQVWAEHAPENLNVLKGWLTTYQDIPESSCKVAHLATLRDLTAPKLREDFTKLFGTVPETPAAGFPKPPPQGSRNPRESDARGFPNKGAGADPDPT